jgi:hypothetical protein
VRLIGFILFTSEFILFPVTGLKACKYFDAENYQYFDAQPFISTYSYTGDWFDDLPHGTGEYKWRAGHRYNGEYSFGVPEGRGVFETARGDIYQGEFQRGLPNGMGEFYYGRDNNYISVRTFITRCDFVLYG